MTEPSQRVSFLTDLALIVDDDPEALDKHRDLLERNPAVRELRVQASELAACIAEAGADFRPDKNLAEAVARTLRARGERVPGFARGEKRANATDRPSAKLSGRTTAPRRGGLIALSAFVFGAGAVGAAYLAGLLPELSPPAPAPAPAPAAVAPPPNVLGATVSQLATSAATGKGLRRTGDAADPLAVGEQLAAGEGLQTDAHTRAGLSLSDGSTVLINHGTELKLDATRPATLVLAAGELLVDAAPARPDSPLAIETPAGSVTVTGTKFSVVVSQQQSSVRVMRGAVTFTPAGGQPMPVLAGQEAIATADGEHSVAPLMHLSSGLRWSELDPAEPQETLAGLGELRAHHPGERQQQERPLHLAEHAVEVQIAGNVARTTVEEVFRNDGEHELEGVYRFPLPPEARIDSLALLVDGQWQEGAFVERDRSRKIWRGALENAEPRSEPKRARDDEYIWVPGPWRDPALLEWQQGGRFELRIFPIPARGERRIRLSYIEVLEPTHEGRRYVYPLSHARREELRVGRFEVTAAVAGAKPEAVVARGYPLAPRSPADAGASEDSARLHYAQEDFLAAGDLTLEVKRGTDSELSFWSYGGTATASGGRATQARDPELAKELARLHKDERGYAAFALRPKLPPWNEGKRRHYVLLVDVSQSMFGERFARARALAQRVVSEMDRRDSFELLACDADCSALQAQPLAPSSQTAAQAGTWLGALRPAGASDLDAALHAAAERLRAHAQAPQRQAHVVYIGDGLASVGPRRLGELVAVAKTLFGGAAARLSTVGVGADADVPLLRALARAGGGHYLPYVPGQHTAEVALTLLESGYGVSLTNAELRLPAGLQDVAPAELPTLRAGEELLITARMASPRIEGELVLRGTVGGQDFENRYPVALEASEREGNRFVPALWASQRIEQEQLASDADARQRITALSMAYGVMSRHTSLLVLESEAMFEAFGVDPAQARPRWSGAEEAEGGESEGLVDIEALAEATVAPPAAARAAAERAAPAAARRRRTSAAGGATKRTGDGSGAKATEKPAGAQVATPGPGGRWIKRTWVRVADIDGDPSTSEALRRAVDEAAEAAEQNPDSRDRHRTLVRTLSLLGNLERSLAAVEEWIARDALDPEALTYLADAIGRQGDRELAIRVLTGIVDLQPDNTLLQARMARAFERGELWSRACAHRRALAEIEPDDVQRQADALRCLRELERKAAADRLLQGLPAPLRARVEEAASAEPRAEPMEGDFMVEATWKGEQDLDVTIVTQQGTRLSWLGGRVNVIGDHATKAGHERLGLSRASAGSYSIEISRTGPDQTEPIEGELRIEVLGKRERIPFTLKTARQRVARVTVRREARLVPP